MNDHALRVAVADDDVTERDAVKGMLEDLGHEVVAEAGTAEQLITKVAEQKPDLVVADLQMPGQEQLQAAEEGTNNQPTPVVMMTSSHAPEQVQKALEPANVVGYLAKPFGSATLDGVLRFAVGLFKRFRGLEARLGAAQRSQAERQVIDRAKTLLMKRMNLGEADAHRKLQKLASGSNKKLIDLAREVVEVAEKDPN